MTPALAPRALIKAPPPSPSPMRGEGMGMGGRFAIPTARLCRAETNGTAA